MHKFVSRHLKESGVFFANVNIQDRPDGNWQGFPVVFRSMDFYRDLATKAGLEVESIGSVKDLGHDSNRPLADAQVMLKFRIAKANVDSV